VKQLEPINTLLHYINSLPLSWLHFSRSKRLLIVAFTYWLGIAGLWLLFPPTHNGASMFLPIVSACWLFRYRGLLASLLLNGIAFQLSYYWFLRGTLPDQAFLEGGLIGFGTSLALGLVVCWLRTTVELLHVARHQAIAVEQERLQALQAERQLTLAYEQQRKINELKDQLLLHVGHELRTPLTVLGGFLELLKDYFERMEPAEQIRVLLQALTSYNELVTLVSHVEDAVTVSGTFPSPQNKAVSIHKVVEDVLTHLDPRNVEAYTIHLLVDEHVQVWANPQYLYRILQNLLTNVFKYVPKQTIISIEAVQPTYSSQICISVQDTGPGIPPDELPLLFDKLMRLRRDLAGSIRGTGLGLFICKHLAEAMGGQIWAESSGHTGEGSRFCIALPAYAHQDSVQDSIKELSPSV
jgi:signal transduction histidine kinase